ncbi:MAG: ArsA family ATPase [Actinomycetota bacterium]|nr:ArsA family ATPase [Actinomycetota bacterium]
MAAALAVEGARRGRRCVVVTIDPAKRLADALGLDSLTDTPKQIDGDWPGQLWALMLDPRSTFDGLVTKYAPEPAQAETILANRFYRNIAGALSGTQEYMAMEKLFELHGDDRFDLVVVDTPPTRNALDFVDAPRRLTRFLDNRLFRLLMLPARTGIRAVNVATQAFLRTIGKVVGAEVVSDAVTFFQAFEGMEDGFRQRAQRVQDLLVDPCTAFVLVTAPRRDAAREAEFFAEKLGEGGIGVQALVVNRMHPRFPPLRGPAPDVAGLTAFYRNQSELTRLADGEEAHVAALAQRLGAPAVRVPELETDVHDLPGLARVAAYVFAG